MVRKNIETLSFVHCGPYPMMPGLWSLLVFSGGVAVARRQSDIGSHDLRQDILAENLPQTLDTQRQALFLSSRLISIDDISAS